MCSSRGYRFSKVFLYSVWSFYCESELGCSICLYAPNLCGSDLLGSLNGSCSISWRTEDTVEIQTISPSQVNAMQSLGISLFKINGYWTTQIYTRRVHWKRNRQTCILHDTNTHTVTHFVSVCLYDMTSICIVLHYHKLCFETLQLFHNALIFVWIIMIGISSDFIAFCALQQDSSAKRDLKYIHGSFG